VKLRIIVLLVEWAVKWIWDSKKKTKVEGRTINLNKTEYTEQ
jgi:hypothetical protein